VIARHALYALFVPVAHVTAINPAQLSAVLLWPEPGRFLLRDVNSAAYFLSSNELQKDFEERGNCLIEILFRHFIGGTEKTDEIPHS
jgi:hypothetical protein